jgi:flagellar biogenesis protein FliO
MNLNRATARPALVLVLASFAFNAAAQTTTNSIPTLLPTPEIGPSLLRVGGALALVLALFLGGVWLFRNWQSLVLRRGTKARLNIVEARSLGGRHAIYVVGYEHERFLIASSPAGVSLLSHLAPASDAPPTEPPAQPTQSFGETLSRMLKGK